MDSNYSFASIGTSTQPSTPLPLEWTVCPGAVEDAYTSLMPHGTIVTANSFTSLFLLNGELGGTELVQYEVHLLTGGLLQIGWCATASGLPFTTNEGVGDFPLSVAADGCRGMVWSLTGTEAPALRWRPGDLLSCYADFASGSFDFALNGAHCCSAALPTKGALLRQGARWYTDRDSTDEMLAYTPALSLAQGEACLVNLGEAPLRYPRRGYASIDAHYAAGSAASFWTESSSFGGSTGRQGSEAVSAAASHLSSGVAATASFAAGLRGALGGTSLTDLFAALDLRVGPAATATATAVYDGGVTPALALLARRIACPAHRVTESVMGLTDWFQAGTQHRWRALCMVLYLWTVQLYAGADGGGPDAVVLEPVAAAAAAPLTPAHRRRLSDLANAASLFLPADHFAVVPGILVAIVQHRMANTPEGRLAATRVVADLAAVPAFRQAWVRETGTFCSTWLNLYGLFSPAPADLAALGELVTATLAGRAGADGAHSNRGTIELLRAAVPFARPAVVAWAAAGECVALLVDDADCHGGLVCAILRLAADPRLRYPADLAAPPRPASYDDGLPYTLALDRQPTAVGLMVLGVMSALGRRLAAARAGATAHCPIALSDVLGGLAERDAALELLPVTSFYLRSLAGDGAMPSNWPDVRLGGSYHHVRRFILDEEADTRARMEQHARPPAEDAGGARAGDDDDKGNEDGDEEGEYAAPLAFTRRATRPLRRPRSDAAATSPEEEGAGESAASRSTQPPQTDAGGSDLTAAAAVQCCWTDSREWESRAGAEARLRGWLAGSLSPGGTDPEAAAGIEEALALRARELPLVTALAASVFVRPMMAASRAFLESFSDATAAYLRASGVEEALGTTEDAPPPAGRDDGAAGFDGLPADEVLREIAIALCPVTMLTDPDAFPGLSAFIGATGVAHGYYWGRMALHEEACLAPPPHPADGPARRELQRREAEESPLCPPRACLMLPLPLAESIVDLWLFSGIALRRGTALAERFPGLFLSIFDAARHGVIASSPTRAYISRAMGSLLGLGVHNRRVVSRLLLAQQQRSLPASGTTVAAATATTGPSPHPMLQGSILSCLDTYLHDDNFNDASALNFLFALAQEESCLLPPPRMLDESFWWCIPDKPAANNDADDSLAAAAAAAAADGTSADAVYFDAFCRATAPADLLAILGGALAKCNRLLTQFSQMLPAPPPESLPEADIRAFHAKYTLLRKSLYVLDFIHRAVARRASKVADEEAHGGGDGDGAAKSPSCPSAAESEGEEASAGGDGIPVGVFLRDSREVVFGAVMDVVVQTVVRVSFVAPATAAAGGSASKRPTASSRFNTLSSRLSSVSGHSTDGLTATTGGGSPAATRPLPPSRDSNRSRSSASSRACAGNTLLPARCRDRAGRFVCSSAPCTVTGLLAPVFAILRRVLAGRGGACPQRNPYLRTTSELAVMLRRAEELLGHWAWWAEPPPLSRHQQGGEVSADDAGEFVPARGKERLRRLRLVLRKVAEAAGEPRPLAEFPTEEEGEEEPDGGPSGAGTVINQPVRAVPEPTDPGPTAGGDGTCLICLERAADLTMRPCGHRCCRRCLSRAAAATAGAAPGDDPERTGLFTAHRFRAHSAAPPPLLSPPRCFFCKGLVQRVVVKD